MIESLLLLQLLAAAPPGASGVAPAAPARAVAEHPAAGDLAALAAAVPDTVVVLPEVRVVRDRAVRGARGHAPTAFTTDLRAGAAGRALETLPDLLADAVGVRVTQYGGLGAFATVSLRGAPPGQVSIYLDGTPLNSAAQGVVNLSDLPFSPIERVEVYRGGAPLALGPALPGGAINLVTLSNPGLREARVVRGAFGTWESHATAGVERGPASLIVHGGWRGSDGNFRYFDDNATPFNPADDAVVTRVNNRYDAANALATLRVRGPFGARFVARELFLRKGQGLPGLGANPALHPRLALERRLTQVELVREARGGLPGVALRGALQRDRTRFRDTHGELRPGRADRDDRFTARSLALDARWPAPGGRFGIEASAALRDERAALSDALDGAPDPPASTREGRGLSAAAWVGDRGGIVRLHAARRWDRLEDRLRAVSLGRVQATDVRRTLAAPQLGARLRPWRGLELRANWSDAARPPDFAELFGDQGSVQGNPALRPERGENRDAGVRWEGAPFGRRVALEWSRFASRVRDLVVYLRSGPSTARAANVSAAEIAGDELSLELAPAPGLSVTGAATWMSAVNRGDVAPWRGKRLPGRPERQASARLAWARGGVRLGASVDHLGENFLDPSNRQRAGARTLLGATLGLDAGARARVTVEGRNLTDRRAADVGGYPLPGRSLFLALELRLGPAGHARP
uniref:TonB-dependent receptor n=1 Tax=Eiseniibacteriota bacterium TaxID=2212470 RepID=A0A832I7N2_UNCEI